MALRQIIVLLAACAVARAQLTGAADEGLSTQRAHNPSAANRFSSGSSKGRGRGRGTMGSAGGRGSQSAGGKGGMDPTTKKKVEKMRSLMVQWWCVNKEEHQNKGPCVHLNYRKKMASAITDEQKQQLASNFKQHMGTESARLKSRRGFLEMYTAFCAKGLPSDVPANGANNHEIICKDKTLKQIAVNEYKKVKAAAKGGGGTAGSTADTTAQSNDGSLAQNLF